jgi:hypothetical protein
VKFQTTFAAVRESYVPHNHILVYHYTSLAEAKKMLKKEQVAEDYDGRVSLSPGANAVGAYGSPFHSDAHSPRPQERGVGFRRSRSMKACSSLCWDPTKSTTATATQLLRSLAPPRRCSAVRCRRCVLRARESESERESESRGLYSAKLCLPRGVAPPVATERVE